VDAVTQTQGSSAAPTPAFATPNAGTVERVDVRLLGGFEVTVDGHTVPADAWRRRHAAALVKLLALQPGHRLLRDQVLDLLWPDVPVDDAVPRLHKAAHYARGTLAAREAVVLSGEAVSLFPDARVSVDVEDFDAAAAAAVSTEDPAATAAALDRYPGDLLPDDLYEPWTEQDRERLRLRRLELLRLAGRWDALVAADPLDEEAHLRLVQQHVRRGDRRAALRQLDQLEMVLHHELGASPSDAALALREQALALPVGPPPPPEPSSGMTPVPRPATTTIGRERDIDLALRLLESVQILTLLGPGGVGKTRLASEVALRRSEQTGAAACFVDLMQITDAALVPDLVVRELGIRSGSSSSPERLLEEALRGRRLLIVLDNVEHVLDAAGIVGTLVQWSADVQVVATSRARLYVPGEYLLDVAPLPVESGESPLDPSGSDRPAGAVALFEQVAKAVDPHFELAPHLADVQAICRSLDGLPLAIELAAGHTRTLPPSLLRSRLSTRLGTPSGFPRGSPAKQQTIPATIDWSLQLLGAQEQRLFARLGVFAGAVPLEAVEHVCAEPDGDVVAALGRLVDQSLVRRVTGPKGEPRFVLLDLLRQRARELLEGEEAARVQERHAHYVAEFLDDLDERRWTVASDRWIDVISGLLPDIRVAHEWAERCGDHVLAARITAALGTYWHRDGHHDEGHAWTAALLPHVAELGTCLAARLLLAAGFVEWQGDQLLAREHWARAVEGFRAVGHDRYLAYSLALLSVTYVGEAESYDSALAMCDDAITLARRVGERPLLAQALNIKGELTRVHGDDVLAGAAYDEGLALATAAGDEAHRSFFLANLGYLAVHRGDHEEARRLGREAVRLCWSLGRRMMAAWLLSELAGPEVGLGRPERGAVFVGAADRALQVLGVSRAPVDVSEHRRVVGELRDRLGDAFDALYDEGTRLTLDEAITLALSEPDRAPSE
jgi:predicted ATPase/DNA-binding SARP family transcriptional activator